MTRQKRKNFNEYRTNPQKIIFENLWIFKANTDAEGIL